MISLAANDLREAASFLRRLRNKSTLPILDQVLVSVVGTQAFLAVTDLDVYIWIRLELAGPSTEQRFCLPRPELLSLAKEADKGSTVRFEFDGSGDHSKVTVHHSARKLNSKRSYTALPADEFPPSPDPVDMPCILPTTSLEAIRIATTCSARDETRYVFNGVYLDPFDGGAVVATDGRRMLMTPARVPHDEAIIPNAVADLLVDPACTGPAVWHCTVKPADKPDSRRHASLTFGAGRARAVFKIVEGNFPNYRQVIPAKDTRRASYTFTPDSAKALYNWLKGYPKQFVQFAVDGPYTLACTRRDFKGAGLATTTVPAAITGEAPSAIAFPADQFCDILALQLYTIDLIDGMSPGVATNGTSRLIIMPVRSQDGDVPVASKEEAGDPSDEPDPSEDEEEEEPEEKDETTEA